MSESECTVRALTVLDESGDTTIVWTEDQDREMLDIIKKKMEEGITFFIIEPRMGGILPSTLTELKKAEDAQQKRALLVKDKDLAKFVSSSSGATIATPTKKTRGAKKSTDPKEVSSSESVAVKPLRGG